MTKVIIKAIDNAEFTKVTENPPEKFPERSSKRFSKRSPKRSHESSLVCTLKNSPKIFPSSVLMRSHKRALNRASLDFVVRLVLLAFEKAITDIIRSPLHTSILIKKNKEESDPAKGNDNCLANAHVTRGDGDIIWPQFLDDNIEDPSNGGPPSLSQCD